MSSWPPANNPFPDYKVKKISDFEYLDELKLVFHPKIHVPLHRELHWQLLSDFRVKMKLHKTKNDPAPTDLEIAVPRGFMTDLSSAPKFFWNIVGPIGSHLEASIVHDYLYWAWTYHRGKPIKTGPQIRRPGF